MNANAIQTSFRDSVLHIGFTCDLLSTNVAALRADILPVVDAHPSARGIVADIQFAGKVDSQGLNLLVALLRETERRGISFRVDNPNPDIRRLIAFLNLATRFGVAPAVSP